MARTKASSIKRGPFSEQARSAEVTEENIAQRAYSLYEARGRQQGHDLDDWLQAERELLEEESGLSIPKRGTRKS
jgi:outer membrane protein TolC